MTLVEIIVLCVALAVWTGLAWWDMHRVDAVKDDEDGNDSNTRPKV